MDMDRSKHELFNKQVSAASDVSGASTTYSLEELSSPEFFSHHCSEIDAMASMVVDLTSIREAIQSIVTNGEFCITIADPREDDAPLIAVSEKFEKLTGYGRSEVLGKNCRFLSTDCVNDPMDLMRLRHAVAMGTEFSSVLTNRRKSGEVFLNLLDLSALTVAKNPCTGEELWFLIGIQADVTSISVQGVDEDHLAEMHEIARSIRNKLAEELSAMAVSGALMTNFAVGEADETSSDAWCLLPMPTWRCETVDNTPWTKTDACRN